MRDIRECPSRIVNRTILSAIHHVTSINKARMYGHTMRLDCAKASELLAGHARQQPQIPSATAAATL